MKSTTFESPHPSLAKTPEFKVILIGASGVGKTCIVMRAAKDQFQDQQNPTIGFAFQKLHKILDDDSKVQLFLWDTAGQERYKSIIQMYYRGAHCAIIVYDITSRDSFENAKTLTAEAKINEYLTDSLLVLVGNKIDVDEEFSSFEQDQQQRISFNQDNRTCRVITADEGGTFAAQNQMLFAEVSARKSIGVHRLFEHIAIQLLEKHGGVMRRIKEEQEAIKRVVVLGQRQQVEEMQGSGGKCNAGCYLSS
ncbi:hypothetical protein FGO68_gene2827 [Halteria grandinella]|uniref:Uncharacterized protein n=1 Tax=Halteria grandinella TaxID=5974 RepID=A0A8J8NJ37_HALGN|nr:hypothetical protein FGO68_gene2827 [Halteria grandinella]